MKISIALLAIVFVLAAAQKSAAAPADDDEKKFIKASTDYAKANPKEQSGLRYPTPALDPAKAKVGAVGSPSAQADHFRVIKVVDAHTIVIVPVTATKPPLDLPVGELGGPSAVGKSVQQAVLDQAAKTKYEDGAPFFLTTIKATDDVKVGQTGPVSICEVTGTKDYKGKDIAVLRQLNMSKIMRRMDERTNKR